MLSFLAEYHGNAVPIAFSSAAKTRKRYSLKVACLRRKPCELSSRKKTFLSSCSMKVEKNWFEKSYNELKLPWQWQHNIYWVYLSFQTLNFLRYGQDLNKEGKLLVIKSLSFESLNSFSVWRNLCFTYLLLWSILIEIIGFCRLSLSLSSNHLKTSQCDCSRVSPFAN